jgi:hypothetical protein
LAPVVGASVNLAGEAGSINRFQVNPIQRNLPHKFWECRSGNPIHVENIPAGIT